MSVCFFDSQISSSCVRPSTAFWLHDELWQRSDRHQLWSVSFFNHGLLPLSLIPVIAAIKPDSKALISSVCLDSCDCLYLLSNIYGIYSWHVLSCHFIIMSLSFFKNKFPLIGFVFFYALSILFLTFNAIYSCLFQVNIYRLTWWQTEKQRMSERKDRSAGREKE